MKLNKYLNEGISDTEYKRLFNTLSNKTRKAINEFDFETNLEDYQIKMLHDIIDLAYQDGYGWGHHDGYSQGYDEGCEY